MTSIFTVIFYVLIARKQTFAIRFSRDNSQQKFPRVTFCPKPKDLGFNSNLTFAEVAEQSDERLRAHFENAYIVVNLET